MKMVIKNMHVAKEIDDPSNPWEKLQSLLFIEYNAYVMR